jgi:voltage-gated potassium channel
VDQKHKGSERRIFGFCLKWGSTVENKSGELKNTSYELFIGALSVLSIVNLVLYIFVPDPNLQAVILIMDGLLSLIFLCDFTYRLFTAESKSNYFFRQMGWADLLASLPAPQFKILRLFRILRLYRLMKIYGGARMIKEFFANRGSSALLTLFFIMILILEFGGLTMLWVESSVPDANITTASDAVWYVYVTITTVGYGDQYPVSNAGRILGVLIMTVGVGLFGTITAFLANAFIAPSEDEDDKELPAADLVSLSEQMMEIKAILVSYEKANANLQAKVDGLAESIQNFKA